MCPDDDDMAFNGDNAIVYLSKLYAGDFSVSKWIGLVDCLNLTKINETNKSHQQLLLLLEITSVESRHPESQYAASKAICNMRSGRYFCFDIFLTTKPDCIVWQKMMYLTLLSPHARNAKNDVHFENSVSSMTSIKYRSI